MTVCGLLQQLTAPQRADSSRTAYLGAGSDFPLAQGRTQLGSRCATQPQSISAPVRQINSKAAEE